MVFSRLGRELQIGTEKRRTHFGDQLFHRVAFIAPFFAAEAAIEPGRVACPIGQLVGEGRRVRFGVAKGLERGQADVVGF